MAFSPMPLLPSAARPYVVSTLPTVAFDAVGAGASTTTANTPVTFAHTASGPVLCYAGTSSTDNVLDLQAFYGSKQMSVLGGVYYTYQSAYYTIWAFGLLSPPSGSQTVTLSPLWSSLTAIKANTVSYTGVTAFGSVWSLPSAGTPCSQTFPANTSASNRRVSQCFFGANSALSAYNQTVRYLSSGSGTWTAGMYIGDAPGSASAIPFTCNNSASVWSNYGAIAVDLL